MRSGLALKSKKAAAPQVTRELCKPRACRQAVRARRLVMSITALTTVSDAVRAPCRAIYDPSCRQALALIMRT